MKRTPSKFSRWNQPKPCRICGKATTWSEANNYVGLDLCGKCFDQSTMENAHYDGYHEEKPDAACSLCRKAEARG